MPKSLIDEILEPYTRTMIDVCYTNIVTPLVHRMLWQDEWRMVKWSKLIASGKYDRVRERANKVFDLMERNGAFCPTVQFYDVGGLQLDWENDGKSLRVFLAPDDPIQYSRGRTVDEIMINNIVEDERFYELLPVFARFVYPPKQPG